MKNVYLLVVTCLLGLILFGCTRHPTTAENLSQSVEEAPEVSNVQEADEVDNQEDPFMEIEEALNDFDQESSIDEEITEIEGTMDEI